MVMSDERPIQRRTFLKASGTAAATVALAGCSSDGGDDGSGDDGDDNASGEIEVDDGMDNSSDDGGEEMDEFPVSITQGNMPSGLDPHDHRETPTDVVMLHAYEGVLTRDADGQIQNRLATDYERVEDGVARFTIREDVQFHNGDDLTPEDVAYSINRIVDESVGFASPQNDQLAGVTSAEAVEGERAVRVNSDGLNPTVFSSFATYCDVMQQSWVEEREKSEIGQDMMGTGPFELDSYTEDQEVVLTRNEDYWDEPAEVSEVSFTAASESSTRVNQLLNGETDITVNVPPQEVSRVANSDSASTEAAPSTRIIYNAMRYDVEPFSDPDFRRAMNYAIDLESIVSNVLEGFGDQTGQPTLEGFVGHNSDIDPYPYEPETAEQLIEDSGHAGAEIELHTPNGRYLKDFEIAQAVVGYIDDLDNVSASVNQRDFGSLVDDLLTGNIEDKPPWYLIGWGEATFDGGLVITALLTTNGALSSYSDDEIDQMMETASNQSGDERQSTLEEVNSLLHERAPWIFLNRQYSVYGSSNRIDWDARSDERIDAYEISRP
jgi:peptide/nickel transport system substrate-binding protein